MSFRYQNIYVYMCVDTSVQICNYGHHLCYIVYLNQLSNYAKYVSYGGYEASRDWDVYATCTYAYIAFCFSINIHKEIN